MLRFKRIMTVCVLAVSIWTFCPQATQAIDVTFPDANLEAAVRAHLGIQNVPITDYDMEYLGALESRGNNIISIQGLEYADNLFYLDMGDNYISNAIPLAKLTDLNYLDLSDNSIVNFFPLADMVNLNHLDLSRNNISDLTLPSLADMVNLNHLDLSGNDISDLPQLNNLRKLEYLNLSNNQIRYFPELEIDIEDAPGLRYLDLSCNEIYDIDPIGYLTLEHIIDLNLSCNEIHDLTPLRWCNVMNLNLSDNQIEDVSGLERVDDIDRLNLARNRISDISTIGEMDYLFDLDLSCNEIVDVAPLVGQRYLNCLNLSCNYIETIDFSGARFSNLQSFDISGNPLSKVILANATFERESFSALMTGGMESQGGIVTIGGVMSLDLSGVDFAEVSDFLTIGNMHELQELFLAEATNLDGSDVLTLTSEIEVLHWLDVTGLWESFDSAVQDELNVWDAIDGNTLVTGFVAGDANGDGRVDGSDVTILANNWQYGVDDGQTATRAMGDFNGDGQVDGSDVTILANNWQHGIETSTTAVPEPGTLTMLLALAGLAGLLKKWR